MHPPFLLDAHVHFWDPDALDYPWLGTLPTLNRPFGLAELEAATEGAPLDGIIFVECNCRPDQAMEEVRAVEAIAESEPGLLGVVAYLDLLAPERSRRLEELKARPLVCGVRHNIQGHPPGFALDPRFVEGVRAVGGAGLVFDLCATHDQLEEVVCLARLAPDTALVLDHCGKPAIRDGSLDPWRRHIAELAALPNVACKLSGLLTEADPAGWDDDALLPYAAEVADRFGTERLIYGGDWPVLTLAGTYGEWYQFTRRFTRDWSDGDRERFYAGNALRIYGIPVSNASG